MRVKAQWCERCLSVSCLTKRQALKAESTTLFAADENLTRLAERIRIHQETCDLTARRKVRTMLITGTSPSVTI